MGSGNASAIVSRRTSRSQNKPIFFCLYPAQHRYHEDFKRCVTPSADNVSLYNPQTQARLQALTGAMQSRGSDATTGHQQALTLLEQTVNLQATLLSFEDMFKIVGWVFVAILPLVFLLGKGKTRPAPGGIRPIQKSTFFQVSRSSKNSEAGSTPEISSWSLARVQAT